MNKIFSRLSFILLLIIALMGGWYIFESSTLLTQHTEQSGNQFYYRSIELPDSLTFAGEKVPLDYFDVLESLDREILVNGYFHSQTIRYIKMAPRYFSIIEPILKADTIPDDFKYLALAESGFDPKVVSPAGAVGFWQFLKGTGRDYGLEINNEVDERYSIIESTKAACKYLKDSYKKFGNWTMVAASYNAGRNGIDNQIERQDESDYYDLLLNDETSRYVFRILSFKLILENPVKYGFDIKEEEKYLPWKTKTVELNTDVKDFAAFSKEHGTNYKILKMLNPWLRQTYLNNSRGKTYSIILPDEGFRTNTN